ncbi:hypothetical protein [Nocardioides sp.]|uniref:hypothetical protein n=1 Tax=Nocardioides sp. TaxID=35761 RepID=UPI00351309BE
MTPTPTSDRRAPRAAVALVLSAPVLMIAVLAAVLSPSVAVAAPAAARPEASVEIFTGVAQGGFTAVPGDRTSQRLRLTVEEVWGDSLLRATEIDVVVPRTFVQRCDRSGAGDRPPAVDGVRYVVRAQRVGGALTATRCAQIKVLTTAERQRLLDVYGQPRPPETTPGGEGPATLDPVVFTCPDDDAVLGEVEDERAACPSLADTEDAGRAALPGAAVALVGLLGLVVARWGARRARR